MCPKCERPAPIFGALVQLIKDKNKGRLKEKEGNYFENKLA